MPSPLRFFRAGPPPPRVALLPDALFFTRAASVSPGATQPQANAEVELALESVSPFPLNQLYYGWFWTPGSEQALVFAAYRRRFTAEQTTEWENAELVLPAFGAVLGAEVDEATTVLLSSPEGWTAVYWDRPGTPSKVVCHPLAPEATDDDRAQVRDRILREFGGSKKIIELESAPVADAAANDREFAFRSGEFVSRLPATISPALDVRDKAALAALRHARQRDVLLWRVALGAVAALLLLAVGEFALMGGRAWQQVRVRQYAAQKPTVDKIASVHELTNRIEDLTTKRLLPLEMVTQLVGENNERLPADIQFTRVVVEQSRGLHNVFIEGKTNNSPQVNAYENALRNLPSVQSAEAKISGIAGDRTTFTLTVAFKPDALKPTGTSVASSQ